MNKLLEGEGEQKDSLGTYRGYFKAGIFHGKGDLTYPDGGRYLGI